MNILRYLIYLIWCLPILLPAQEYKLPRGERYQKVKFKLVNNLIVLPVEVNGAKLSFILDSGVYKPILFNISDKDSVQINNVTEVTIRGLGDGEPISALKSSNNVFKIGKSVNYDQLLYIVMDKDINFSPKLGMAIHGIIGYDLFRDFVVKINYGSQTIKLYDPENYTPPKKTKSETLPLVVENNKAYIQGTVFLKDNKPIPVKLLIDTGSSDAVWLFENNTKGIGLPENSYEDFLGQGLSGKVFGKRTKIEGVSLGTFHFKDAKAAFPDMEYYSILGAMGDRDGSLGGEILKRFSVVFDYHNQQISLKKNGYFKDPFHFNLSGLDIQHNGVRYISESITDGRGVVINDEESFGDVQILFEGKTRLSLVPEIVVSGIRAGSPAQEAGLKEGDIILSVNGKKIYDYKLQEIIKMLNDKQGKRVKVLIERYNKDMLFSFVLKDMFK
ncbi:PDZ domain-containing protein [Arenibacter sp. 6A1]|uniref:aspartyl protease family protein n=1 Tax=Arenibacter sp. 6A1 TaxID=2720391 RepID=UPI0014482297|nr:aspartyl protease family protein [Arenibacter sp. 6A1]NKI28047.1 PDZ domain-containing protein [Arenibacter sp. 6A1]